MSKFTFEWQVIIYKNNARLRAVGFETYEAAIDYAEQFTAQPYRTEIEDCDGGIEDI